MKKKWLIAAILLITAVSASACSKETENSNKLSDLENMTDADNGECARIFLTYTVL